MLEKFHESYLFAVEKKNGQEWQHLRTPRPHVKKYASCIGNFVALCSEDPKKQNKNVRLSVRQHDSSKIS